MSLPDLWLTGWVVDTQTTEEITVYLSYPLTPSTVKKGLLYTVLLLLGAARVSATPIIRLTPEAPYQRIATQVGWLVDNSARLTLAEIKQPAYEVKFQPGKHELGAYGVTDAAVWVHGSFSYAGRDKVYLLIEFANIDSITLYYYDQGILKTVPSGSYASLKNKDHNIPGFCLEIPAAGDRPQEFWLRIRTGNAVIVPLALTTADGLPKSLAGMYVLAILYAGIVLAMFWYNLSLSQWIEERDAYIYYLGYLFFLAIFVLLYLRGFHVLLGQPLSYIFNQFGMGTVAVSYLFAIRFSVSFLHGKDYAPRLVRILKWMGWLLWITVACCLAGWRHATIRLQEFVSLTAPILFIWMAVIAYRRNYKPALYFIIAWSTLLLTIVLFAITNMGLLPFGNWTFHILPIGSAIEVILLSLALGDRYASLEKDKQIRKEAELQFVREQRALLEQNVNMRTRELQNALEQLEESNRAKDKLLNIIAHDIRSPLNNLSGYLELAEKRVVAAGQIQQFIQVLRRNISNIAQTMNNLLNWSLKQKNHIETNPSKVALSPMTRQILDTYRFSAEQKGVDLKKSMPEEMMVVADSHQLELILRNLLDNAIKFTPQGGAITIGCRPRAEQVVVYVADTGAGMLQEEANKLLHKDSFHSTGGTANEKGTGLGLQLCKEFVASNGGVLQVRSAPGEGTEFYFSLPGVYGPGEN